MGALGIMVALNDDHGPVTGLGTQVTGIKVVLLRCFAGIHGQDVGRGQFLGDGLVGQDDGLAETARRHGNIMRRRRIALDKGRDDEAVCDRDFKLIRPGRSAVVRTFAVFRQQGIKINHVLATVRDAVGYAGDDHAAVTVPDENDIVRVFPEDDVDYILNVRVEINVRAVEIGMFPRPVSVGR